MPRYDQKDYATYQAEVRSWEVQHAGYCGRCGLPYLYCLHRDPEYRLEHYEAVKRANRVRWEEVAEVQKRGYVKKLNAMPLTEVCKLPMPPKRMFIGVLRDWLKDKQHTFDTRPPTIWERLMAEDS